MDASDPWFSEELEGFCAWSTWPDMHVSYTTVLGNRLRAVVTANEIRIERYGSGEVLAALARDGMSDEGAYDAANAMRRRACLVR